MKWTPFLCQEKALDFELNVQRSGIFMQPGLGKSVSTLTAQNIMQGFGMIKQTLILAPKRVAETVWKQESEKWDHLDYPVSIVVGTKAQRIKALQADAAAYVTNFESLKWLTEDYFVGKRWPFDVVIADESSKLKNEESGRSKAAKIMSRLCKRWVNLTGTPATNGLGDLWHQIFLQDFGYRLCGSYETFRNRFFTYYNDTWIPRPGSENTIHELISDITVSMEVDDYIDLPAFKQVNLFVQMPAKARRLYETLESEMYATLETQANTEVGINAVNGGALTVKCRQLANGAIKTEKDSDVWEPVHDAKLKALQDLVDEHYGEPLLVCYSFNADLERVMKAFPDAVALNRTKLPAEEIVRLWNARKIPMLLLYPGADAHGLNLQFGGRAIIWYGLVWDLDAFIQGNGRLRRPGQKEHGFIYKIVAEDTIEEAMLDRLESKDSVQNALMKAIKKHNQQRKF